MSDPISIVGPVLLIRVPQAYRPGMSDVALYEATRGVWRVGPRRDNVKLAFAVVDGVVMEVYAISSWQPALTSSYSTRTFDPTRAKGRWEFVGRRAADAVRARYLGRSVAHYFRKGAQNPTMYVNVPA